MIPASTPFEFPCASLCATHRFPWAVEAMIVSGGANAAEVAALLIGRSAWFDLTPLPDDKYHFLTKPEGHFWAVVVAVRER